MKIGLRKPSLKKSFKAMTTGKAKRKLKKALIPGYGKKGIGLIKNPKRAIYNKVYNKTTIGAKELLKNKKVILQKCYKNIMLVLMLFGNCYALCRIFSIVCLRISN